MDAIEVGLTHLKRMKQKAEELTEALGLPSEAKYKVLSAAYKINPSLVGGLQKAQPEVRITNEARLKEVVYQLTEGFLSKYMKSQIAAFQSLWVSPEELPLEMPGLGLEQSRAATGLGFAGHQQLLSIVSTISWAVLHWATLSQGNTDEEVIEVIRNEAKARGCSLATGSIIASYLQEHVPE